MPVTSLRRWSLNWALREEREPGESILSSWNSTEGPWRGKAVQASGLRAQRRLGRR